MGVKIGSDSDRIGFKRYKKQKTFMEDAGSVKGSQSQKGAVRKKNK